MNFFLSNLNNQFVVMAELCRIYGVADLIKSFLCTTVKYTGNLGTKGLINVHIIWWICHKNLPKNATTNLQIPPTQSYVHTNFLFISKPTTSDCGIQLKANTWGKFNQLIWAWNFLHSITILMIYFRMIKESNWDTMGN